MPHVSVLLPVHNGARFLHAAITSIREQDYRDWELIVVDDGSTDTTAAIIAAMAAQDPRIRIVSQTKSGIVAALEAGRHLATGALLARMDGDDIAVPDRFRKQVDYLERHARVVAVGGQILLIDAEDRVLRPGRFPVEPAQCRRHVAFGAPLCHPAVMMRSAALAAAGGYRHHFEPAEDFDLWLRLLRLGELANLSDTVLKYRLHDSNVSTTKAKANATAAALALACERYDPAHFLDDAHGFSGDRWLEAEATLPAEARMYARAAYFRALVLNGGIADDAEMTFLLNSASQLFNDPQVLLRPDVSAFMLLRAVYRLVGAGHWAAVARVTALACRYVPAAFAREILSVSSSAVRGTPIARSTGTAS